MHNRLKYFCIGLGLVLLLTLLFLKTTSINTNEHNRYTHGLRRLKELHATLDKRVLESRYGLLTTYDYVNQDLSNLQQMQSELATFPSFLRDAEKAEIQRLLQEHIHLLELEGKTLERFKSQNAILNNSLRYFPAATAKILESQAEAHLNPTESANLNNILQDVLIYYLLGNQVSEAHITQQIQGFIEAHSQKAGAPPDNLPILLSHATVILRMKPEIDKLLSESVAYPSSELIEKINHQYESSYQQARQRAEFYGFLLFGVSMLLLGYIGYIIVQLKQATLALHATNETLEQRVQERTADLRLLNQELQQSENNNNALIYAIPDSMWRMNREGLLLDFIPGKGLERFFSSMEWEGKTIFALLPFEVAEKMMLYARQSLETGQTQVIAFQLTQLDRIYHYEGRIVSCSEAEILVIVRDTSEQKFLEDQLQRAQKLESIGQLAAGIAHEINTPTQYVGDNTRFVQDSFSDLETVLSKFNELLDSAREGTMPPTLIAEVEKEVRLADVEYLLEEIPHALQQSLEGVNRIAKIVQSMKEFAHPGSANKKATNLNHAIESTITVARNEWKYIADLETDFAPDLPLVPCLVGEFNQVILNLIINATHAITDAIGHDSNRKGTIKVSTRCEGHWAEIRVSDSGTGIPESVREKIFDPFFTTKEVGKGTGQGLAISHAVVVEKHGGQLTFETELGKGTTFIIRLPLDTSAPPNEAQPASHIAGGSSE